MVSTPLAVLWASGWFQQLSTDVKTSEHRPSCSVNFSRVKSPRSDMKQSFLFPGRKPELSSSFVAAQSAHSDLVTVAKAWCRTSQLRMLSNHRMILSCFHGHQLYLLYPSRFVAFLLYISLCWGRFLRPWLGAIWTASVTVVPLLILLWAFWLARLSEKPEVTGWSGVWEKQPQSQVSPF